MRAYRNKTVISGQVGKQVLQLLTGCPHLGQFNSHKCPMLCACPNMILTVEPDVKHFDFFKIQK